MNKICKSCNSEKETKDFYKTKSKSYPDSLLNSCKACIKEYRKERRVYAEKPSFSIERKEIIYSFD